MPPPARRHHRKQRLLNIDPTTSGPARRRQPVATRLVFLIAGTATACWAGLVPFARARLAVNDGMLGLLLLCLGCGSIAAMPVAGWLTGRMGCRRMIVAAALLLGASLPLLAIASSLPVMAGSLLLFGASLGSLDVAMNVQAIQVERDAGRPMMSGFHGMYSAGGIVGAGCMSGLLLLGLAPLRSILAIDASLLLLLLVSIPWLRPAAVPTGTTSFLAMPRGPLVVIGLLCAACFLAEGAMVDWSALLLSQSGRLEPARAGFGYAAFSTTMTIGRFCGDRLVKRLGGASVLVAGSLVGAAGVLVAVASPGWIGVLAGLAAAGAGLANLAPLLIGAAGRQPGTTEAVAVAAVGTLGYAGILAGPALLGFVASGLGLPAAFLLVALLLLTVPFGRRLLGGTRG